MSLQGIQDCPVCFSELDPRKCIILPCGCNHCDECLKDWIITKCKELDFQTHETIKCMNENCKEPFEPQSPILYQFSSNQHQLHINEALFEQYLNKKQDIRKCPNNNCNYAGIIDVNSPCLNPLECSECNYTWKDPMQKSCGLRLATIFCKNSPKKVMGTILSWIWHLIFTKNCPNCGVAIQKNGGCPHMTCSYCNEGFCWLCMTNYINHKPQLCLIIIAQKITILLFIIGWIFRFCGVVGIYLSILKWTGILILANGALVLSFLVFKEKYNNRYATLNKEEIIILSLVYAVTAILSQWFHLWITLLIILGVELGLILFIFLMKIIVVKLFWSVKNCFTRNQNTQSKYDDTCQIQQILEDRYQTL